MTSVRAVPRDVSVTVTMAPATAAPVWSLTVPRMRPALPCAKERKGFSEKISARTTNDETPRKSYCTKGREHVAMQGIGTILPDRVESRLDWFRQT